MISFHARVAMQRNNAAFVLAMCLAVVCHLAAAQGRDWDKLRDGIRRLRMELARQDVYTFVTNRTTTPRVAPYIHSQCWVDWLPKGEERRRAVSKSRTPSPLVYRERLTPNTSYGYPHCNSQQNTKVRRSFK